MSRYGDFRGDDRQTNRLLYPCACAWGNNDRRTDQTWKVHPIYMDAGSAESNSIFSNLRMHECSYHSMYRRHWNISKTTLFVTDRHTNTVLYNQSVSSGPRLFLFGREKNAKIKTRKGKGLGPDYIRGGSHNWATYPQVWCNSVQLNQFLSTTFITSTPPATARRTLAMSPFLQASIKSSVLNVDIMMVQWAFPDPALEGEPIHVADQISKLQMHAAQHHFWGTRWD